MPCCLAWNQTSLSCPFFIPIWTHIPMFFQCLLYYWDSYLLNHIKEATFFLAFIPRYKGIDSLRECQERTHTYHFWKVWNPRFIRLKEKKRTRWGGLPPRSLLPMP
nr:hypothetical protein [Solanum melongena]WMB96755.1 hypothetical protein [Solanum melongena]WMB96876.1 hypothetical protein [Solanum melongena]WMB97066.1 hypothetical protein [Solanum aethiopicum]